MLLQFQNELAELAAAEKQSKLNNFVKSEKNIVSAPLEAFKKGENIYVNEKYVIKRYIIIVST